MTSYTEENYLKIIYQLLEKQSGTVSTNEIAAEMQTKAASVTDMLGKLSKKKLINYKKYKGVTLTNDGEKVALNIIRKHRLWELFLVEKLNFKWHEVHEVAEQLEHIQSDELIKRLDRFLKYPKFDPHGDPIPDDKGKLDKVQSISLADLNPGENCFFKGVVDHSDKFLRYLDSMGISLGEPIKTIKVNEYDKSIHLKIKKKELYVSYEVAKNILVEKKK